MDPYVDDNIYIQSDFCSFVCFCLACYLETEQHFLVCSLGHLAAEVMWPLALLPLSFENLKDVIWKWIWAEDCVGWGRWAMFAGLGFPVYWVPGESNKCSILEMLYWISLLHTQDHMKGSEKPHGKENCLSQCFLNWFDNWKLSFS